MHLESLKLFCDLAETKSFTEAAQKNGVTQSAVSQQLATLEKKLRSRLVTRKGKSFKLTAAGNVFLEHSREITRLADELEQRMQQARETTADIIELAACFSIGLHQLPPFLRQFRRDFPGIKVHVRYGHIDRVHELVRERAVDLGLVAYPRRLPELFIEPVRREPLVLVCHPQHPLAVLPAATLADVKGHPLVAWSEIHRDSILKSVPVAEHPLFAPRHEFNEVEIVKQAVEMNAGVAILPAATVASEVAHHLLVALPFEQGRLFEPLAVIYRDKRRLTPAMQNFIQALKQPGPAAG
jgi:DNA-binding transcriptional LysR family regulator